MSKRYLILSILLFCCGLFSALAFTAETQGPILSIVGLVQSPMHLTLNDLQQFRQEAVSAGEPVASKGEGAVRLGAVPLKNLLELAKPQDPVRQLAISIKNSGGKQIILSWGEIFLPSRNRVFIASSANTGDSTLLQNLPALILAHGNNNEVSLCRIASIEVTTIAEFASDPANTREVTLDDAFSGFTSKTGSSQDHPLSSAIEKANLKIEPTDVINIAAGNRNVVVSAAELKSDAAAVVVRHPAEDRQEIAYDLVFPGDSNQVRRLEDIKSIEVINLKQKPMIYVVGVGCGDPNLLTNEAISIMGKADVFVSNDDYQKTFAGYIAGKRVLFDPFMQLARYQKASHPELTDSEAEKKANKVYADNIQMLRKALKEGKIVALLEPGDPTLYGGWRNWLSEYIPKDQLTVIAGMSSFSVANAVLGEFDITRVPLIIAEPEELKVNEALIQTAAQNGNVIVVFMGLNRMKSLVPLLGKYLPPDTPLIIVYYAGIAGKERRVQTSLSKAIEVTDAAKESFLGLIYVGRDLKDSN
jgi:precorrin-2 methylase